jgi:hypothetical protein
MWRNGIVLCVAAGGKWELAVGGPKLGTSNYSSVVKFGQTVPLGTGKWHTLSLTTVGAKATGMIDKTTLFTDQAIRDLDTGFGAIGSNDWFPIEYDNVKISQAGTGWTPTSPCGAAKVGDKVGVRACSTNGIAVADEEWILNADWCLTHKPSGLCAAASSEADGATLSLAKCDPTDHKQQWRNDYTRCENSLLRLFSLISFHKWYLSCLWSAPLWSAPLCVHQDPQWKLPDWFHDRLVL